MHDGFADTESGPEMVVWRFGARAGIAGGVVLLLAIGVKILVARLA